MTGQKNKKTITTSRLLKLRAASKCIITIDALGVKIIAKTIRNCDASDIPAPKQGHKTLLDDTVFLPRGRAHSGAAGHTALNLLKNQKDSTAGSRQSDQMPRALRKISMRWPAETIVGA